MRQIAILLLFGAITSAQEQLTPKQTRQVAHAIMVYRLLVLEDSTPVNFCSVKEFWDADGEFIGDDETRRINRYPNTQRCKRAAKDSETDYRSVLVEEIVISGDTVFAYTTTKRGGSRFWEEYVLTGRHGPELRRRKYSVLAIIQH